VAATSMQVIERKNEDLVMKENVVIDSSSLEPWILFPLFW
jgi:hypothetical protein